MTHRRNARNLTARRRLTADDLYPRVKAAFGHVTAPRTRRSPISLADALMAAFAMFSLKDPSLLIFDARRNDANLKRLFHIQCNGYNG